MIFGTQRAQASCYIEAALSQAFRSSQEGHTVERLACMAQLGCVRWDEADGEDNRARAIRLVLQALAAHNSNIRFRTGAAVTRHSFG